MNIPLEKGAGSVRLIHRLRSQDDGASEIERGVGVMILVEAAPTTQNESFEIIVDQVSVKFDPRPRDENVTV